jgi:hypothetical protein
MPPAVHACEPVTITGLCTQAPITPLSKDGGWMEDWLAAAALGGGGATAEAAPGTEGVLDGLVVDFEGLALELVARPKPLLAGRHVWQRAVGRVKAAHCLRDFFQERCSA